MDFRQYLRTSSVPRVDMVPFFNVIFLVIVFFMLVFIFAVSAPLNIKLPRAVTSDMVHDDSISIVVTSENIMYIYDKVTTLQELGDFLAQAARKGVSVLIKADRRASMGRVVDIMDLGRGLGIERINIAVDQEP